MEIIVVIVGVIGLYIWYQSWKTKKRREALMTKYDLAPVARSS